MEYTIIRSNRKTLSISVNNNAQVIVHAPYSVPEKEIERFVDNSTDWIEKSVGKAESKNRVIFNITAEDMPQAKLRAKEYLTPIAEYYSSLTGLCPTGIKITTAKTRLGSCSGKNSVCFSVYLINYPEKAVQYVVLHELAHIRYKNHSKRFYGFIEKYMPDYKERVKLIKTFSSPDTV